VTVKWLPYLSSTIGGRVDWVHTTVRSEEIRDPRSNLEPYREGLSQNDVLYGFYLSNELELNCNWTVRLAGGYAQRPPTLLERYADGVFLTVVQSGLSRVIGTPTLEKERGWQVDFSAAAEYDRWYGRIGAFYSWVDDPITYIGFPVIDPTGAYLLRYTNGNMFTRTGFEMFGDWDLTERLTLFGNVRYLRGRDQDIFTTQQGLVTQALTGIFPLSSNVGIRLHDAQGGGTWGVEFAMRMVDTQNRTGGLRVGFDTVERIDPDFEQRTGGFTVFRLRGYYNVTRQLYVVGGIDNLFDRTYLEHLNQRLPEDTINGIPFREVAVIAPGITPYFGFEWNY
jgi:iron complex outermembrane receptor protein